MKFLRALVSLLIGFVASYFLEMNLFNTYSLNTDRIFLTVIPALAIGILLFEASPAFLQWTHRIQSSYSIKYYFFGFLLSLIFTHSAVGFLNPALQTSFSMVVFSVISIAVGSTCGYYLVRRAVHSFRDGFLSKPLNLILAFVLPLLLLTIIYISLQFPEMFTKEYITLPQKWLGLFIAAALAGAILGLSLLDTFESKGYYELFKKTKLFGFISQNLPGLYAGGMFFLINMIIARALNQPALGITSVLFETDAGPWMTILGSPASGVINRSVHPLVLITLRPLIRLASIFMGDQWQLASIIVVAGMSGLCVFMAWLFIKRASDSTTHAFIFAAVLGSTSTHLLFGSLTENYIFGAASLIFFFLLIQANEKRFSVLLPAGLLLFGITITNIAQGVIGLLFNNFGFRRLIRYCILLLASGVALTILTITLYPRAQTLFFIPSDIAFESNFVKTLEEARDHSFSVRFQVVSRTMFLYGIVGPKPVEVIANKEPFRVIDFKTFNIRNNQLASYSGFANLPLILWLIVLAGSFFTFIKNIRTSKHGSLMLGLLGALAFNFSMHLAYGTELFLYTPYWMYALIFFIALAYIQYSEQMWFKAFITFFLLMLIINNVWFIFAIMRGLAPFMQLPNTLLE